VLEKWIQFIKAHERLFIVLFVLSVGLYLGNKYINYDAARKDAQFQALTSQVQQDKALATQNAVQSAADLAKYQDMLSKLQQQNQNLLLTIQSDNVILKSNQTKNNNATLPEVAVRLSELSGVQSTEIIAENNKIDLTDSASHAIVNQLEEVPVLKDQLDKQTLIATNDNQLLNQCQQVNGDLTKQVSGLNVIIVDTNKQHQAEIADIKAQQRKKSRNWFVKGAVIGATIASYLVLHY